MGISRLLRKTSLNSSTNKTRNGRVLAGDELNESDPLCSGRLAFIVAAIRPERFSFRSRLRRNSTELTEANDSNWCAMEKSKRQAVAAFKMHSRKRGIVHGDT